MPLIDKLICTSCTFSTKETSGGYSYTIVDGRDVTLSHPCEIKILKEATGLEWHEARACGLLRHKTYCICYSCCAQFYRDIDREEKCCTSCNSLNVRTFTGAISETCPACHKGILKLHNVGIS